MNYLALKIAIAQLAMHGSYANIPLKFLMEPRGGCSKYFQLESFKSISVCRKKKAVEDRLLGNNYQHVCRHMGGGNILALQCFFPPSNFIHNCTAYIHPPNYYAMPWQLMCWLLYYWTDVSESDSDNWRPLNFLQVTHAVIILCPAISICTRYTLVTS